MKLVYLNGPYHRLPYSRSSRSPAVTKSGTIYYPVWLAYAAGLTQQETDFDIELIDAVARRWDHPELVDYLKQQPPDVVFCDTSTPSIDEDLATAAILKQTFTRCRIVLVGTHATARPEEVFQRSAEITGNYKEVSLIDAVIRGEYDVTAIELARALAEGSSWENISGVTLYRDGEFIHTPDRELLANLDKLPFVSKIYKQHLRVEDYFFAAAKFPMTMIITSRGCPHGCRWCLYPQVMHRGRYRTRSSANVAAEFAFMADEMPEIREVGIEDDLFTGNKKRLREICELLIRQNNKLNFWCDTRVDLDYETMRLLKAAGCRLLIAGFESADQIILDKINKGTKVERAFQFMTDARRVGLLVHGCFVLGNPGETHASMQATLEFAKKLDPDTVQFFPMIVYPGTGMYDWARDNNYLRSEDYRQWLTDEGLHNSVVDLPHLPGNEVLQFCDHARREFYLRRSYIFRKLAQSLTNIHEARRNVKAFRRFARHLVKTTV